MAGTDGATARLTCSGPGSVGADVADLLAAVRGTTPAQAADRSRRPASASGTATGRGLKRRTTTYSHAPRRRLVQQRFARREGRQRLRTGVRRIWPSWARRRTLDGILAAGNPAGITAVLGDHAAAALRPAAAVPLAGLELRDTSRDALSSAERFLSS